MFKYKIETTEDFFKFIIPKDIEVKIEKLQDGRVILIFREIECFHDWHGVIGSAVEMYSKCGILSEDL